MTRINPNPVFDPPTGSPSGFPRPPGSPAPGLSGARSSASPPTPTQLQRYLRLASSPRPLQQDGAESLMNSGPSQPVTLDSGLREEEVRTTPLEEPAETASGKYTEEVNRALGEAQTRQDLPTSGGGNDKIVTPDQVPPEAYKAAGLNPPSQLKSTGVPAA